MNDDPKAKVLTDADVREWRAELHGAIRSGAVVQGFLAALDTIDALRAELALKDKVVTAARRNEDLGYETIPSLQKALTDLDKVITR